MHFRAVRLLASLTTAAVCLMAVVPAITAPTVAVTMVNFAYRPESFHRHGG